MVAQNNRVAMGAFAYRSLSASIADPVTDPITRRLDERDNMSKRDC